MHWQLENEPDLQLVISCTCMQDNLSLPLEVGLISVRLIIPDVIASTTLESIDWIVFLAKETHLLFHQNFTSSMNLVSCSN